MYYQYFDPVNTMFHILGWVLFVWFVIWLLRSLRHGGMRRHSYWCDGTNCNHPMHGMGGNRALDLLKERYAKGEINTQEFEEKKKNLM
jgi:uncharacterized membrane protein